MKRSDLELFWQKLLASNSRPLTIAVAVLISIGVLAISFPTDTKFSSTSAIIPYPKMAVSSADTAFKLYRDSEQGLRHTPLAGKVVKLRQGDTLLHLLNRNGIDGKAAQDLIASVRPHLNPRALRAGQKVELIINSETSKIQALEIHRRDHVVRVSPAAEGWQVEERTIPSVKETRVVRGAVSDSLYENGLEAGLLPNHVMELASLFEYDIDLFSDFQSGDEFSVLFDETRYENGLREPGNILAAELEAGGEPFSIFRFADRRGRVGYFDAEGKTRRRAFLRAPLSYRKITSRYSLRRRHPISRRVRPHQAIDYAAPKGTPVVAIGSGKITYSGRKGGYGKMVEIRHENGYATRYAHFSRIAARIRPGRQVNQGQIIGYVGQTGHATGPHLHFELLRKGKKMNFLALKIPTVHRLSGPDLQRFNEQREERLALLKGRTAQVARTRE